MLQGLDGAKGAHQIDRDVKENWKLVGTTTASAGTATPGPYSARQEYNLIEFDRWQADRLNVTF